jgi:hypothetical protein
VNGPGKKKDEDAAPLPLLFVLPTNQLPMGDPTLNPLPRLCQVAALTERLSHLREQAKQLARELETLKKETRKK